MGFTQFQAEPQCSISPDPLHSPRCSRILGTSGPDPRIDSYARQTFYIVTSTALHCTALHCTALHCTSKVVSHNSSLSNQISKYGTNFPPGFNHSLLVIMSHDQRTNCEIDRPEFMTVISNIAWTQQFNCNTVIQ